MNDIYLDSIRAFEGFTAQAQWDYAQHSNGYGTRALYPGEVIGRVEAERRFQSEIAHARAIVERHAEDLDEGTKAALTSLTFNAGATWTRSGLGDAVRRGDLEAARELFLQYNKAGGETLPGLAKRRIAEAGWIGDAPPASPSVTPDRAGAAVAAGHPVEAPRMPGLPAFGASVGVAHTSTAGVGGGTGARDIGAGPLAAALRLQMALALTDRPDQRDDEGRGAPRSERGATS